MKQEWNEKITVHDFGQDFTFRVVSEHLPAKKIARFQFTDVDRHFTIEVVYFTKTEEPDHEYSVSPENSLSSSHLSDLVEKHLEPIIIQHKAQWK